MFKLKLADAKPLRDMVTAISILDDFASYFLWLLRKHRDVAQEALRRANGVIEQPAC